MKHTLIAAFAMMGFIACNNASETKTGDGSAEALTTAADNTLTDAEKKDGWQLLFDGSTKNGWHIYGNKSDGSAWVIDSGAIHLAPMAMADWQAKGGGDIATDSEYANFDFKVDWKIDTGGNSGIIFYSHEGDDSIKYKYSWYTGPEMQVLDNARNEDAKYVKHHAGDLYDLIASSPETVKPALEWNHVEIIANNGHLELYLNGTKVAETTMWDDNWKKLIADSKFKDMPDFGSFKSGKIVLQDHGFNVWFKNIKIKNL